MGADSVIILLDLQGSRCMLIRLSALIELFSLYLLVISVIVAFNLYRNMNTYLSVHAEVL